MSDTRRIHRRPARRHPGSAAARPSRPPRKPPPPPPPPQAETPLREQQLDKYGRAYATGRRKDAVARVWLKPGSGRI